jgi:hypothetical protein
VKRSVIQQLKDGALEKALLLFLRPRFERYGEITTLSLNTSERVLSAEILLRGEPTPLHVHQARYRTEQEGEDTRVVIYDVKVSKEWAQNLVDDRFREISLKIPQLLKGLVG